MLQGKITDDGSSHFAYLSILKFVLLCICVYVPACACPLQDYHPHWSSFSFVNFISASSFHNFSALWIIAYLWEGAFCTSVFYSISHSCQWPTIANLNTLASNSPQAVWRPLWHWISNTCFSQWWAFCDKVSCIPILFALYGTLHFKAIVHKLFRHSVK